MSPAILLRSTTLFIAMSITMRALFWIGWLRACVHLVTYLFIPVGEDTHPSAGKITKILLQLPMLFPVPPMPCPSLCKVCPCLKCYTLLLPYQMVVQSSTSYLYPCLLQELYQYQMLPYTSHSGGLVPVRSHLVASHHQRYPLVYVSSIWS